MLLDLKSDDKLNPKEVSKTKTFFHVTSMEENQGPCNEICFNQYS